jgi:CRISPR-associated protein Csd1
VLYVWWSPAEAADFLAALISGDSDEAVADTLDSVLTGRSQPDLDPLRFIGVSLGANSARVVVRSWTDITIGSVKANLRRWFGRTSVVGHRGSQPRALGAFLLLAGVAPPGQGSPLSRLDPGLVETLITAALDGSALPPSLLAHTLARTRAELGHLTAARAALLKACITPADHPSPEKHMTALDTSSTDAAYLCGRLLAMLDDAARLATSANNALVDRSYSAASTMPATTFTRLLRLHRAHIDKLRRDNRGAAVRIDQTVTEILGGVRDLPRTFSIAEQARFALGLYHQQAEGHAARERAKAARLLSEDQSTQEAEA